MSSAHHSRARGRVAVFLGAGATVPLGYPMTSDILPRILTGLAPGIKTKDQPHWRRLAEKRNKRFGAELRGGLAEILPGLKRAGINSEASIIDVLSVMDQLIADGYAASAAHREGELRHTRRNLNVAINGVLRGQKKPELVQTLVSWVRGELTRRRRVSLISTNYDTAFELPLYSALTKARQNPAEVVDMGTSILTRDSTLHHRPREARLAVLKLHGSLNWLRCEVCAQLYVNTAQRTASLDAWQKPLEYNTCQCDGRLRSLLVTPSLIRDVRDAHLLSIWTAALNDLRAADEWLFIGYSLPHEDVGIRAMLLRAFNARGSKSLRVRAALWDPDEVARRTAVAKGLPVPAAEDRDLTWAGRSAEATLGRYRALFPAEVFDDKADYFPGGVGEILDRLHTEGPRGARGAPRRGRRVRK